MNKKGIMELATELSAKATNIETTLFQRFFVNDSDEEIQESESTFYQEIYQLETLQKQLAMAMLSYLPDNEPDHES